MKLRDVGITNQARTTQQERIAPPFQRVRDRMARFDIPLSVVENVFRELLGWVGDVASSGGALHAPAVFCSEDGNIEFEWDHLNKSLIVVAQPDGTYEVTRIHDRSEQT